MQKHQIVALDVSFNAEDKLDPPSEWNWSELTGETVEVVAAGPVLDDLRERLEVLIEEG